MGAEDTGRGTSRPAAAWILLGREEQGFHGGRRVGSKLPQHGVGWRRPEEAGPSREAAAGRGREGTCPLAS